MDMQKAENLVAKNTPLRKMPAATVYPPNTPMHLVPRSIATNSKTLISLYVVYQLFVDFEKTCKKRITPTGITEGERGFEQTKECYLTEVMPFFKQLKGQFESLQKGINSDIKEMEKEFDAMIVEVNDYEQELKYNEVERKNLHILNENLISSCVAQDVFYTVTKHSITASRFHKLSIALKVSHDRVIELENKNSELNEKIDQDDHDNLVKHLSKLKYQHLKENVKTSNIKTSSEFGAVFQINKRDEQIQAHCNTIRKLKAQISQLKGEKNNVTGSQMPPPLDSQYSQTFHLQNLGNVLQKENESFLEENEKEIENLRSQEKGKLPLVFNENVASKSSSDCKYTMTVKYIPPHLRNNELVFHNYFAHLKDSLNVSV